MMSRLYRALEMTHETQTRVALVVLTLIFVMRPFVEVYESVPRWWSSSCESTVDTWAVTANGLFFDPPQDFHVRTMGFTLFLPIEGEEVRDEQPGCYGSIMSILISIPLPQCFAEKLVWPGLECHVMM